MGMWKVLNFWTRAGTVRHQTKRQNIERQGAVATRLITARFALTIAEFTFYFQIHFGGSRGGSDRTLRHCVAESRGSKEAGSQCKR